jgi:uncharacterized membrane protein
LEQIQNSLEVHHFLSQVYNQWTQFEECPRFMEGEKEVKQLDDKGLPHNGDELVKELG